jgi:hypothetical protein
MSKRQIKIPKMSAGDIDRALRELDAWCLRERVGRLTWKRLEDAIGFTRQAMSGRDEIARRYGEAKAANRPETKSKPPPKNVDQRVADLSREVERLKALVNRYDERWARYARNAALLGIDLEALDAQMDPPARALVRVTRRPARSRLGR